jgi:hypothetical protein
MGIPSEPGGSPFNDLPFLRRRKMGMRNKKIARKIFMICVWLWFFEVVGEGGNGKISFRGRQVEQKMGLRECKTL